MNVLRQIAVRNVFRNRRRTALTLAAIVVALVVVLVITAINNAFHRFTVENAVNSKLGALQIHKIGYLSNLSLNPLSFHFAYSDELLNRVSATAGVKAVTGRIKLRGLISNGRDQALFFGSAVDVVREGQVCPKWLDALSPGGSGFDTSGRSQVILGLELGRSLAAQAQEHPDSLQQLSDTYLNISAASPAGRQNAIDVRVQGLLRSNLPIEEKRALLIPLQTAQALLGLDGQVTEIAVAVHDFDDIGEVQARLQNRLGPGFEVSTWADVQPFLRDVVFRQRVMIGIVSLILFVLAVFVIANTMTMAVFERTREIGTMLSVGVTQKQIRKIFVFEAFFVGLAGATIGLVIGLSIVWFLARQGIPFGTAGFGQGILYPDLASGFVFSAFSIAVSCAVIAGLAPAHKASRMRPVDALRSN